ncbi:MAG TPA: polysaccharide deacetylase family protein [Ktedonobacterales bacterium]
MLKQLVSPVLDAVGNAVLMSPLGDLGTAHRHGSRERKIVALTFDDGPVSGGTEDVLDALEQHHAPGTFFFIGANILMHPDIVRRAYQAGHAIGAHSMNHSRLDTVSFGDAEHIDDCVQALQDTLGRRTALYRPPWGWMTPWEARRLHQRGLAIIRWDLETPDWKVPCPPGDAIAAWTLPQVRPGTIIVFHDGMTHAERHEKPETALAVRLLIPALRDQGYDFATIPELLDIPAYTDLGAVSEPSPADRQVEQQHTAGEAARSAYL